MRLIGLLVFVCLYAGSASAQSEMTDLKKMEVERLRIMAEAGAVPRARLDQAQAELADAEDNAVLRRTLYGTLRIEDFTKEQSEIMISAAERLVGRQRERIDRTKQLVQEGIIARVAFAPNPPPSRRHVCAAPASGVAR